MAGGRPKGSKEPFNALAQNRANKIWRDLIDIHGFDWGKEFMQSYRELDDPRDRLNALNMVWGNCIGKAQPVEAKELESSDNSTKMKEEHDLLKAIVMEKLRRECQTGPNSSFTSDPASLPQPLLTVQLEQESSA